MLEAGPLGVEMLTALAHRGIETHLVDENAWLLAQVADPEIAEPVQESIAALGATLHFGTGLKGFEGSGGKLRAVVTSEGEIEADICVVCHPQGARDDDRALHGPQGRLDRRLRGRRAHAHLDGGRLRGRRLRGGAPEPDRRRRAGPDGLARHAAGPGGRGQRGGRRPAVRPGQHPLGHGRRAGADRRGQLRRAPGHLARHPLRRRHRQRHQPRPLLPRRAAGARQAPGRARHRQAASAASSSAARASRSAPTSWPSP